MTFEEAMKLVVEKATDYWGTYRVETLVNDLQETYAPKIKMTGEELDFLNSRFKTNDSSGSKVFIDANGRKIEISPRNLQAWLYPELIEAENDSSRID